MDFLTATTKSLLDSNFADKKFIPAEGKNVLVIGVEIREMTVSVLPSAWDANLLPSWR